jgi:hypothetical protein
MTTFKVFIPLIFLFNCIYAENYAILISGDRDTQQTSIESSYMGPDNSETEEFWHDLFLVWESLYTMGFKDENIYIFFEDGYDISVEVTRYSYPLGISSIVDYDANRQTIIDFFDDLYFGDNGVPEITEDDFLFL